MKKFINYKTLIFISLFLVVAILVGYFVVNNNKSYAIENNDNKFLNNIEIKTTNSDITINNSDLRVSSIYSNNDPVFKLSNSDLGTNYIKSDKVLDSGIIYILSNSFPNKDIIDKDGNRLDIKTQTWITQVSIWLYLQESNNILDSKDIDTIKNTKELVCGEEAFKYDKNLYDLYINKLVNNALKAKEDELDKSVKLFNEDKIYSTKDNKYYQSSELKVITNDSDDFKYYQVELVDAPRGSIIVNDSGNKINKDSILSITDSLYVRIPKNSNNKGKKVKIKVTGIFDNYDGYIYKSEGYSDLVLIKRIDKSIDDVFEIDF